MPKTIKELALEAAKKAAKESAKDAIVTIDKSKEDTKRDNELNSKFYKALAERDHSVLRELNGEFAKDYASKGQSVGTDADGGYLVPTTLDSQIREALSYLSPIRQIATVIGNMPADLNLPFENALPTTYWVGEGTAPTESKSTFTLKNLVSHKMGGFGKFTHESLVDTAVNPSLQSFVAQRFALSLALKENDAFVNGDGSSKPYGFRSSAITPASNAIAGSALAYGDLVKTFFAVHPTVRANGVWVMSTAAIAKIVGLVDSQNRPLYVPAMSENAPATVLGRPVYEVPEIPSNLGTGTNETEIWFGDFKNYIIGDREAQRVTFGTTGTDLESDKISLVLFKRVAGLPIYDSAFAKLTGVK